MKERKPIFYDAQRIRWRFTRRALEISGVLLTLLLVYFFVTIAGSVELPAALFPDAHPNYHSVKSKLKPVSLRPGRHARVANLGNVPASYDPLRAAFFVSWDPNSLASLKRHYKDIDLLIPEQLHAVTPDGAITVVNYTDLGQPKIKASPEQAAALLKDDKLHQWMRSLNLELPMMGLLNNYDGTTWHIKEMAEMLANPAARQSLVRDLVSFAIVSREAGLVVDFEEVPEKSQDDFEAFIGDLAPGLHAVGLKLMVELPAREDIYDYEFFGQQADAVLLNDYDEHWLTSGPGPIASQDWFVENLLQVFEVVPPRKVVVTIGNYAYDWPENPKKSHESSETLTVQEALLRASESEAQVEF